MMKRGRDWRVVSKLKEYQKKDKLILNLSRVLTETLTWHDFFLSLNFSFPGISKFTRFSHLVKEQIDKYFQSHL